MFNPQRHIHTTAIRRKVEPLTPEQEEARKKTFMDSLKAMFKNLQAMEERLTKKGREPITDKAYRRIADKVVKGAAYARKMKWMAPKEDSNEVTGTDFKNS